MPLYLRQSQVERPHKETANGMCLITVLIAITLLMYIVKVKVKCNQTGKFLTVNSDDLTTENGEAVRSILHGEEVIYTDNRDGKSYDVQIWDTDKKV